MTNNTTALQNYVELVRKATQENDHTGAIRHMATYARLRNNFEADRIIKCLDAIETLHKFYGHLPTELGKIRSDLTNLTIVLLKDWEAKEFNNAIQL